MLTAERLDASLLRFSPLQRVQTACAEFYRARHWLLRADADEMRRCYQRTLDILESICRLPESPENLEDFHEWRNSLVAHLETESPALVEHMKLEASLILLHPDCGNVFPPLANETLRPTA